MDWVRPAGAPAGRPSAGSASEVVGRRVSLGRLSGADAADSPMCARPAPAAFPSANRAMIRGEMFDRAEPDPNPVALAPPIPAGSSSELPTPRLLHPLALLVVGHVGV